MQKTIATREYAEFIERLKSARKKAGLKQTQVAKKLKRPQSYISRVESGEYRIDVIELKHFAKLYNVDVRKLLGL